VHERRPRKAGPDEAISTHSRSVSWARHPVPESSGAAGSVDDQALTRDEHEPGGPRVFVFPYFYDHLPVRRVLRPVFTFLRSSILLLVKTAAGPVGVRAHAGPMAGQVSVTLVPEGRRARMHEGQIGALRFSLRRDDLTITCLTCEPGTGGRSPPPRGRRCPIETTSTSTQAPTMRGVES